MHTGFYSMSTVEQEASRNGLRREYWDEEMEAVIIRNYFRNYCC